MALVSHFAGWQGPELRDTAGIEAGRAVVTGTGPFLLHGDGVMLCKRGSKGSVTKKGFHSTKFCVKLFWLAELGRGALEIALLFD